VAVVSGLQIAPLLDQLERTGGDRGVEQALDGARSKHPDGFASGKAITALVSGCAKRKNSRLAHSIWNWCKKQNLDLNTFHYNSMIAVAASDRKPQEALQLMKEMSHRNITKNEVT
jgi:pentatricopeptide repeat protein